MKPADRAEKLRRVTYSLGVARRSAARPERAASGWLPSVATCARYSLAHATIGLLPAASERSALVRRSVAAGGAGEAKAAMPGAKAAWPRAREGKPGMSRPARD